MLLQYIVIGDPRVKIMHHIHQFYSLLYFYSDIVKWHNLDSVHLYKLPKSKDFSGMKKICISSKW